MSGVILATFWCKRHGQDFRLEERAAAYKKSMEAARKAQEEDEKRIQKAKAAMRDMMMGLRFEKRDVPVVKVPVGRGLSVRFLCDFRDGVFLTAYCQGSMPDGPASLGSRYFAPTGETVHTEPEYDPGVARGYCYNSALGDLRKMKPGEDFYTVGCFFDPADRRIHEIRVEEISNVYAGVVAGGRAWFAGLTDGQAVLVGVGARDRITVPLPQADEIPDLGMDGRSLLAVYSQTVYRLTGQEWTSVHSGYILLPRSGPAPQRHGNTVFLRDEGEQREMPKRLWWLTMGEQAQLRLLDRDTGLGDAIVVWPDPHTAYVRYVGPPGWEETSSYCVTRSGDLWACVGNGSFLLRRSKRGSYAVAIENHSVQFVGDWSVNWQTDPDLCVSAVTALPDDTLLLAGFTGLYRLKGNELVQELAFAPEDSSGKAIGRHDWEPSNVLALDDGSYLIGCERRGVYLLRKGDDGQWSAQRLGQGDPIVW